MKRGVSVEIGTAAKVSQREELISGSEAVAEACRLANVDVVGAYPIRPYDTVMNYIAKLIANGDLDAEFIVAESEHSQFEIAKHASAVGARAFAGSSGVGWLYAFEAIAVTASLRLPVVAMVGNRALDDPGAFGVEHNDALTVRDLGWLLTWIETAQEALDTTLIAYKVAEDRRVQLPCALAMDGAFLTHSQHLVNIPDKEAVKHFLPPYQRGEFVLHPDNPITIAPQVNDEWLMEIRKQTDEAMKRAKSVIQEAYEEFAKVFGRASSPFLSEYMTGDADVVLVGMGTLGIPVRAMVKTLRDEGQKVGYVRVKWFRPFPTEELQQTLSRFKAVGVIDRDYSFGSPGCGGVLFNEIRAALYSLHKRPNIVGFIAGLGGREITDANVRGMSEIISEVATTGSVAQEVYWIGVRE